MSKIFKTKKARRQAIIALVIILVVILAALYAGVIKPILDKEEVTYKEELVEKGTLTVGVTESGSLDFGTITQTYDLDLSIAYDDDDDDDDDDDEDDEETVEKYLKIEKVNVAQGQRISKGDLLFTFTEGSVADVRKLLQNKQTELRLALADAKADYNSGVANAKLTYDLATTDAEYASDIYAASTNALGADIAIKQADLASAKVALVKLQNEYDEKNADSTYWSNRKTAYSNWKTAEYNWSKACAIMDVTSYLSTYNTYTSAKKSYENYENQLNDIADQIQSKKEEIEDLQYDLDELKRQAYISSLEVQETYSKAIVGGVTAQDDYESTIYSLQASVDEAQEKLDEINELLEQFEAFVGNGNVYASGSGIVTEVGYKEDDTLRSAGTLVSYAPEDNLTITVNVSQEDIVDLKVGDQANVIFSAYEDELYTGTITSITTTKTSSNTVTVSYPVVISIAGETDQLYDGMTANVTFVTETKEDILYVSKKAIVTEGARKYVYRLADSGEVYLYEVEVGFSDGFDVEITSGLSEGDSVYIPMN